VKGGGLSKTMMGAWPDCPPLGFANAMTKKILHRIQIHV